MGRTQRRNEARGKGAGSGGWKGARWIWIGGAALLAGLLVLPALDLAASHHHPEPRTGVTHEHVVPGARYAAYPRVAHTYDRVAAVPHIVDGIYCYCACSEHSAHYSLLDCFRDDHAARCDICLSEADMAHRMHVDGRSLDEIRTAIDRLYAS